MLFIMYNFKRLSGKYPFDRKKYEIMVDLNKRCIVKFNLIEFDFVSADGILQFSNLFQAIILLKQMLSKDPKDRPSAEKCLESDFFLTPRNDDSLVPAI